MNKVNDNTGRNKMAKKNAAAAPAPEPDEAEEEDVNLPVVDKSPAWLHEAHSEWLKNETGEDVSPRAVQLVYGTRVSFRKSGFYREAKEEAARLQEAEEKEDAEKREAAAAKRAADREAAAAKGKSSEALAEAEKAQAAPPAKRSGKKAAAASKAPF